MNPRRDQFEAVQISTSDLRRIDRVCDAFERTLKSRGQVRIEELIEGWSGPARSLLLRELLCTELHYAQQHGERLSLSDYVDRFPQDVHVVEGVCSTAANDPRPSETDRGSNTDRGAVFGAAPSGRSKFSYIGRYEIRGRLGAGGFGTVYLAHDSVLKREVAIKVPNAKWRPSDQAWELMRHEAELTAGLSHPFIVKVFDIDRDEKGCPYIVMEYIRGKSLAQCLKGNRLEPREIARIMGRLAEALAAAHQVGLVHRDLKPANVLLDEAGEPHLVDLGLAIDGPEHSDHLAGTCAYMSPEQVRCDGSTIGPRSDIWSMGVMIHEMLTGQRPFQKANRRELLDQILSTKPRTVPTARDRTERCLLRVTASCLQPDADKRYACAAELMHALHQINKGRARWSRYVAATLTIVLAGALLWSRLSSLGVPIAVTAGSPAAIPGADRLPPAPPPNPAVPVFRLLPQNIRVDTWEEAIAAASSGDTVEISIDGPFVVDPVELHDKALIVRATEGCRPVLELGDSTAPSMIRSSADLLLEGLELRRKSNDRRRPGKTLAPSLVDCQRGALRATNCRFVHDGVERATCIFAAWSAHLEICNCEFYSTCGPGITGRPKGPFIIRNNVFAGEKAIMIQYPKDGERVVQLSNNSIVAREAVGVNAVTSHTPLRRLQILAYENLFDVDALVFFASGRPSRISAAERLRGAMVWRGADNQYCVRQAFLRSANRLQSQLELPRASDWNSHCDGTDVGMRERARIFSPSLAESLRTPLELNAQRFAVEMGDDTAESNATAGAALDRVGPDAYVAFQRSEDYVQWRQQHRRRGSLPTLSETQLGDTTTFAVVESQQSFATLAEAISNAGDGGHVDVRGNGPFRLPALDLGLRSITIQAGAGYRPILELDDSTQPKLFRTAGSLVLDGLELRREVLPDQKSQSIITADNGSVTLRNCGFVLQGPPRNFCLLLSGSSPATVQNCNFYHTDGVGLHLEIATDSNVDIEGCRFVGRTACVAEEVGSHSAQLSLTDNVFETDDQVLLLVAGPHMRRQTPKVRRLQINSVGNTFHATVFMTIAKLNSIDAAEAQLAAVRSAVRWHDTGSRFQIRDAFLTLGSMRRGALSRFDNHQGFMAALNSATRD